jgi:hypothetical protein
LIITGPEVDVVVGVGYARVYAVEVVTPPPARGIVVVENAVETGISCDVTTDRDLEVLVNVVFA